MEEKLQTDKLQAVQRMQDYILEHVNETISMGDLAKVSLFSPWYAFRLFKEYTDYSPADYIRRIRLSKSALLLRDEDCKVIDVAFQMGFQSVDGYQRAFLREFGCNPREYAKRPVPLPLFIPYGVIYNQIRKEYKKMEQVTSIFIQLVHKPERKVLIKRGKIAEDYFAYCDEVGCDIWGLLTSIKSISGEPVSLWLPDQYREENTSLYVQGAEVEMDYAGEIPEGLSVITLPEADYLMFQGEPFLEEDYCQAIDQLQTAMNKYNPETLGYVWDDSNPRIQLEPIGTRGYIELVAVKKKDR